MKSWEENVKKVEPYIPGEQPNKLNMIKLNTNECPYPPSPQVKKAIREIESETLRFYPDPEATILVESLAKYYQVKKEQVFVGVGSDDVLAMAFLIFFNGKEPILFPDITYSFYDVWAELFGVSYSKIPLEQNFAIDPEDYNRQNGGIIIPNPNAPTGILETVETIEAIIKANPNSVVIIDEAYIDFGGESCLSLVDKYENLLVVQTFSKSRSMAGMRIGFAIGSEKIIQYLNDGKFSFNSYTMNQPSLICGVASIEDDKYFKETVSKIIDTRERVKGELSKLGFQFPDSKGNFLFVTHPMYQAKELYEALKEANIFVRYFPKARIDNYLRITIGTDKEMNTLIKFLQNR